VSNGFEDAAKIEPVRIKGLGGEAVGGNFYELVGGKATFRVQQPSVCSYSSSNTGAAQPPIKRNVATRGFA
jgi:hypothetical protein